MKKKFITVIAALAAVCMAVGLSGCKKKGNTLVTAPDLTVTKIEFGGEELTGLDLSQDEITLPELKAAAVSEGGASYVASDAVIKIYLTNSGDGVFTFTECKLTKGEGDWAAYFTDGETVTGEISGEGADGIALSAGGSCEITFTLKKSAAPIAAAGSINVRLFYSITIN
jgi:hypothetical protein